MTSMYGWTEEAPPPFDEPDSPNYLDLRLSLQAYKAAVIFDMVHRHADSSEEHDRIIDQALETEGADGTRDVVAGFIRLVCGALTEAGADTSDPDSEYDAFLRALRTVAADAADFRGGSEP